MYGGTKNRKYGPKRKRTQKCVGSRIHIQWSWRININKYECTTDQLLALCCVYCVVADVFGWPKSQCMFPAWTTRSSWKDMSGRHVYTTNDMGDVIDVGYRSTPTSPAETSTSLRCFRILARNTTANHVTVIAFAVRACSAKYQCISFVKRKDSVIELHKGSSIWRIVGCCVQSPADGNQAKS